MARPARPRPVGRPAGKPSVVTRTAPIAAATGQQDVLVKLETAGGRTDWRNVAEADLSADNNAEAAALLNNTAVTDVQQVQIGIRIASAYRDRGAYDEAARVAPNIEADDSARGKLLGHASNAWAAKYTVAYNVPDL